MASGGTASNGSEPFVLSASPDAPLGHLARIVVTATDADGVTESSFDIPIGRFHYLVWDPSPDTSSGPTIASFLAGMGFSGAYVQQLPTERLDDYQTVWVSLGIYSNNFVIGANSPEALAVINYLNDGGCVYMEGGDTWYYDPQIGGHNFRAAFGISALEDGTSDCGPVNGRDGTFTKGMHFSYAGENEWIDRLAPASGDALLVLENGSPIYGLGVAYDPGPYRTVGTSFELGGLNDGLMPSTRAYLALSIMDFFLPSITDVEEELVGSHRVRVAAHPNPFNPTTTISFMNPAEGPLRLALYDVSGRLVRVLQDGPMPAGRASIAWDGRDGEGRSLSSGVYFARLTARSGAAGGAAKLVLLK